MSWGNYARFVDYTAKLNWFLPVAMIPAVAIIATAAETLFGLLLVLGWRTRLVALLSGALLTTFGLAMTVALGVKAPLNLSVFSAAGGALLLAEHADVPFSVDELLRRIGRRSDRAATIPHGRKDRETLRRSGQPPLVALPRNPP